VRIFDVDSYIQQCVSYIEITIFNGEGVVSIP